MKRIIALLSVGVVCVGVVSLRSTSYGNPVALPAAQTQTPPTTVVATPYQTEQAWATREIIADIDEMARYRSKKPAAPIADQPIAPWQPDLFTAYAAGQFAGVPRSKSIAVDPPNQYRALANLTAEAIVAASVEVSAALKRDITNPRAHEAAALVLSAFALRDAAGGLSDVRWALNRMTAHLAVANALRDGSSSAISDDGLLARAALMALSNHGRKAVDAIAAMPPRDDPAFAVWKRALTMRTTQDWRAIQDAPHATRLEKLEYFRARRMTIKWARGGQELTDLREPPAADFGRIVLANKVGVEDGGVFAEQAFDAELAELGVVYRIMKQRALPDDLPADVINARAGRLLSDGEPQVVPWGAWAEFSQRHIGQAIGVIDHYYRKSLALPDRADAIKKAIDGHFAHLTLFPIAASARTIGNGEIADMRFLDKTVDVAIASPELVTFDFWTWLEPTIQREWRPRQMPKQTLWFAVPSAAVPYEAGRRLERGIPALTESALNALVDEAPTDLPLIARTAQNRPQNPALVAKAIGFIKARGDYDLWAVEAAINASHERAVWLPLMEKACALAVTECGRYARAFVDTDPAKAAAEFAKAFRNPALDRVTMSNTTGWLVSYYERNGQLDKAFDLAEQSAAVGSGRGMLTLAGLLERRNRVEEARELFEAVAKRYPGPRERSLAAFYYRQAVIAKRAEYVDLWKNTEQALFPGGLKPTPVTMANQPAKGIFVDRDSTESRKVRLQAGDIIVGVDGFQVENEAQFATVMAFGGADAPHKFTAWRGVLFTVELPADHGMTLKGYPLVGLVP